MASLFAIHDTVAECDVTLFVKMSHTEARDAFVQAVRRSPNPSLQLFIIAEVDISPDDDCYAVTETGRFKLMDSLSVINAINREKEAINGTD